MPPARLYLSLHGRIGRRCFWLRGLLPLFLVSLVLVALLNIAGLRSERADVFVNGLLLWPTLAVLVKRWHDRDRSGWWVLVLLVPLLGFLFMLVDAGCLRGTPGPNRFGEVPAD